MLITSSRTPKNFKGQFDRSTCSWFLGIVPKSMTVANRGPAIHRAKIWESQNFIEAINRSRFGYSDGTGGH